MLRDDSDQKNRHTVTNCRSGGMGNKRYLRYAPEGHPSEHSSRKKVLCALVCSRAVAQ
jgi:hypothetical protein